MKTWKYTVSSDTSVFAMSVMVTVLQAHETPEGLLTCRVCMTKMEQSRLKIVEVRDFIHPLTPTKRFIDP